MDYIITSTWNGALYVWCGHYGWSEVLASQPYRVNRGHGYATWKHADAAIKRNLRKQGYMAPHSIWAGAKYLTLKEARADDNPLGIKWD